MTTRKAGDSDGPGSPTSPSGGLPSKRAKLGSPSDASSSTSSAVSSGEDGASTPDDTGDYGAGGTLRRNLGTAYNTGRNGPNPNVLPKTGHKDNLESPPADLNEMIHLMLKRVGVVENKKVFPPGKPRSIRLGTMCSGTDSPVFALTELTRQLKAMAGFDLEVDHIFSCEIVPFKQSFIYRNTGVKTVFRDVIDLGKNQREAPTALGSMAEIPTGLDLLVAGCSCTEFSALNMNKKTEHAASESNPSIKINYRPGRWKDGLFKEWLREAFESVCDTKVAGGESDRTFYSMLSYVYRHRPTVVVLENVQGCPWEYVGRCFGQAGYAWSSGLFDTKDYFIPQTRSRGYLVAVDGRQGNRAGLSDEMAFAAVSGWGSRMERLRHCPNFNVVDFLLLPTDPILHYARMEIESRAKECKEANWAKSKARHDVLRHQEGLDNRRPLTRWMDGGIRNIRASMWKIYFSKQVRRVVDLVEIIQMTGEKTRNTDFRFKAQCFDLSQNPDRNKAKPAGSTGCLTPKGIPYITLFGRPITGLEALRLQGIPQYEIVLANETNEQLQDLAGNAMSVPVVGAAMISILMSLSDASGQPFAFAPTKQHQGHSSSLVSRPRNIRVVKSHAPVGFNAPDAVTQPDLQSEADIFSLTRAYCPCHDSALHSRYDELFECRDCKVVLCSACKGNPHHNMKWFEPSMPMMPGSNIENGIARRRDPMRAAEAVNFLQRCLPHKIELTAWTGPDLGSYYGTWLTKFFGSPVYLKYLLPSASVVAVYASVEGQLHVVLHDEGVRLYAKPAEAECEKIYEQLGMPYSPKSVAGCSIKFVARTASPMPLKTLYGIQSEDGRAQNHNYEWEVHAGMKTRTINVSPESYDGERLLVAFPDNEDAVPDVAGMYRKLENCDAPYDILYRHLTRDTYIFQDIGRTSSHHHDRWVICPSHGPTETGDRRDVLAVLPLEFDPRMPQMEAVQGAGCLVEDVFTNVPGGPRPKVPTDRDTIKWELCEEAEGDRHSVGSKEIGPSKGKLLKMTIDFGTRKHTETAHVSGSAFSLPGVIAPVTRAIRSQQLPGKELLSCFDGPAGPDLCIECCPDEPETFWNSSGDVPFQDPHKQTGYESGVRDAPEVLSLVGGSAGLVEVPGSDNKMQRLELLVDAEALRHRAAHTLDKCDRKHIASWQRERLVEDQISVAFNVDLLSGRCQRQDFPSFLDNIPTEARGSTTASHALALSSVFGRTRKALFPTQVPVVAWAMERESGKEAFEEQEVEERTIPHMSMRLSAVAKRKNWTPGGILALDVGQGKTIITLALIKLQRDRREQLGQEVSERRQKIPGFIHLSATLVIVPRTIVDQWAKACRQFLRWGDKEVVVIRSLTALKKMEIAKMKRAKIIIASFVLFGYTGPRMYGNILAAYTGWPAPSRTASTRAVVDWHRSCIASLRESMEQVSCDYRKDEDFFLEVMRTQAQENKATQEERVEILDCARTNKTKRDRGVAGKGKNVVTADKTANEGREDGESTCEADDDGEEADQETGNKGKTKKLPLDQELVTLLEIFSYERVVWDEVSYADPNIDSFVQNVCTDAKWLLSGTPDMSTLGELCRMAENMGIHVARKESAVIPGYPHITRGPTEKKCAEEECAEELAGRKSPEWALQRHAQGQRFVQTFFFKPLGEQAKFDMMEKIILVDQDVSAHIGYQQLQSDVASAQMSFENLSFRKAQILQKRETSMDKPEGVVAELLLKLANSPAAVYADHSARDRRMNGYANLPSEYKFLDPEQYGMFPKLLHTKCHDTFMELFHVLFKELKSRFDQVLWLINKIKMAPVLYGEQDSFRVCRVAAVDAKRVKECIRGFNLELLPNLLSLEQLMKNLLSDNSGYFGGRLGHLLFSLALCPALFNNTVKTKSVRGIFNTETLEFSGPLGGLLAEFHWFDWFRLRPEDIDEPMDEQEVRMLYLETLITGLKPMDKHARPEKHVAMMESVDPLPLYPRGQQLHGTSSQWKEMNIASPRLPSQGQDLSQEKNLHRLQDRVRTLSIDTIREELKGIIGDINQHFDTQRAKAIKTAYDEFVPSSIRDVDEAVDEARRKHEEAERTKEAKRLEKEEKAGKPAKKEVDEAAMTKEEKAKAEKEKRAAATKLAKKLLRDAKVTEAQLKDIKSWALAHNVPKGPAHTLPDFKEFLGGEIRAFERREYPLSQKVAEAAPGQVQDHDDIPWQIDEKWKKGKDIPTSAGECNIAMSRLLELVEEIRDTMRGVSFLDSVKSLSRVCSLECASDSSTSNACKKSPLFINDSYEDRCLIPSADIHWDQMAKMMALPAGGMCSPCTRRQKSYREAFDNEGNGWIDVQDHFRQYIDSVESPAEMKRLEMPRCQGLHDEPLVGSIDSYVVSAKCGHILCSDCVDAGQRQADPICPVVDCGTSLVDSTVPARSLQVTSSAMKPEIHGAKCATVVSTIMALPRGTKIIVFYQYKEIHDRLKRAMEDQGLDVTTLENHDGQNNDGDEDDDTPMDDAGADEGKQKGKAKKKAKKAPTRLIEDRIRDFTETNMNHNETKVLMLNITSSDSAGVNLDCARHVMFVSPLYERNSQTVIVYHFATKFTLEVDILEARLKKRILANDRNIHLLADVSLHEDDGQSSKIIGVGGHHGAMRPARSPLGAEKLRAILTDPAQGCDVMRLKRPNHDKPDNGTIIGKVFGDMRIRTSPALL
ncbi:hypothetical protein MKZ38_007460 [Zalerion maritima]|uniref:Helicase ATP-binding domain-containing protein n=1 Tax=Zalerion maritima TaxID=339359 RepID=A0AAD5RMG4_9PEZI|nr:hypothetical protein MKZ38_007460 [Zalerion maritima]